MMATEHTDTNAPSKPRITLLIDGLCPLCAHEARFLRKLDKGRGRLGFMDIAAPDFDPAPLGLTQEAVIGSIHGVLPDGSITTGTDVFRRAYRAVGWGWLWAPTGWPVLKPVFDVLYKVFARIRPRLSKYNPEALGGAECTTDRCKPRGA
ncbi:MAG: DUF393 domain-containing protein [Planctomycetota bacterium]